MIHEGFRVPDRAFWALAIVATVLTWTSLIIVYPLIPNPMPIHFTFTGQPDSWQVKSWFLVFLPAIIQVAELLLMSWVYRFPQYANMPTSMALTLIPEPWKSRLTALMRHMIVMIAVIVTLIFAFISHLLITDTFQLSVRPSLWWIIGLVGVLFVIIIVYTLWLYRWAKAGVMAARRSTE